MSRGFVSGLVWGGLVAGAALAVVSQVFPHPDRRDAPAPAVVTAEAPVAEPAPPPAAAPEAEAPKDEAAKADAPKDDVPAEAGQTAAPTQEPAPPAAPAPEPAPQPAPNTTAPTVLTAPAAAPDSPVAPASEPAPAPSPAPSAPPAQGATAGMAPEASAPPKGPAPIKAEDEALLNPPALQPKADAPGAAPTLPQADAPRAPLPQIVDAPATGAQPMTAPESQAVPDAPLAPPPPVVADAPALPGPETGESAPLALAEPEPQPKPRGLPQIGAAPEAEAAEDPLPEITVVDDLPPIAAFARPFENPEAKPLFAILLVDDGRADLDRAALAALPFPVTFVVDPQAANAQEAAAIYRGGLQEVVMAATGLPEGAEAADVEQTFQANAALLPETVAVLEAAPVEGLSDRALATALVPILHDQGRGLLTYDRGINAADQIARRAALPTAQIFRVLDAEGENRPTMRRYLDRAAFKAAQEGRVVVLGTTRPDTVAAILEWTVEGRAASVALAPVTAILSAP